MPRQLCRRWWPGLLVAGGMALAALGHGQEKPAELPAPAFTPPAAIPGVQLLPINLATALRLASANSLDVAIAAERVQAAAARLDQAKVLWLPTLYLGGDYFRHDGQIQSVEGNIFGTSKSTLMAGAGPVMVFAVSDAIFEPLAARQVVRSRQASLEAAANDNVLAVAEAYFAVQQARGELSGAEDAARRAAEVAGKAEKLAPELAPPVEVSRARAEQARRRQAVQTYREKWRTASAELVRLLRLDPATLVDPLEPPQLEVTLVPKDGSLDEMIAQALTQRPELAAQQALVQATLRKLREERLRPLVPSVLLRGAATNPAGILAGGVFAGGRNERIGDPSARGDIDLQILWELQNLGFGNRAKKNERKAEHQISLLELFRVQDRVAAEVVQAYAQAQSAAARIGDAESGLKEAIDSATKNIEGMAQTKRPGGNVILLVIRPQEAVASVQALSVAYGDYYGAVADYNRAQFRLWRALGKPAATAECAVDVLPPPAPLPPRE